MLSTIRCAICHAEIKGGAYKCVGYDTGGHSIYTCPGPCYERRQELEGPGMHIACKGPGSSRKGEENRGSQSVVN
jgi:hypothetical protein